ncbi:Na(+)/H(+) exchange regulatory cofactor NHE-RF3 [Rhinophrynus dorsalis]
MASTTKAREYTVTKKDGKGYGFCLRIEKDEVGHLVRSIEAGSSADKAGLKDGDRVLRVNRTFVDNKEHAEVVSLIKDSGNSVTLLVLDSVAYENAKKKGEDLSQLGQNPEQPAKKPETNQPAITLVVNGDKNQGPRPRLCYLDKEGGGSYGFSLKTTKGVNGIYMSTLVPNSIAVKAGVRENDRIIEVNGKNVENDTHDQLAKKVKESGNKVMFLLSDKDTDDYFKRQKMKITGDKATVELLPFKPRIVELKKDPNGYGFFLRQEKNRKGHFVMEVDPGSPAEKAKLKDYDRIVAVNGESMEQQEHEEVVEAIRRGGDKATFLIVDKKTDELYTMAGVSPYLFLQESQEETNNDVKPVVTPVVIPSTAPSTAPAPSTTSALVSSADPKHKPRLCRLQKGSSGYGFHLNAVKEIQGQFIKQVVKGGPADVAGVKEEDILLEVNGVNVEKEDYEDVVMRIKDVKGHLILLVISKEAYEYFKTQKIPVTASMADPLPDNDGLPSYAEVVPANKARSAPEPIEMSNQTPEKEPEKKEDSSDDDDNDKDNDEDEDNTSL